MRRFGVFGILAAAGLGVFSGHAAAQVRIGQWNITNYSGPSTRDADFRTALYALAPGGLQFAPDILVIQEIVQGGSGNTAAHQSTGQTNVNAFLSVLNTAPNSPGDWSSAPYVANGGDTGNAIYYRTSRFSWLGTATLAANTGTGADQAPRDTQRWRMRLAGYTGNGAQIYLYGAHFKAGSTAADQLRRNPEGERIRLDSNALPDDTNFVVCADMNVQNSSQTFYQYMVGLNTSPPVGEEFLADATGRFFDPINSTGTWENNGTFRFIHTQEPATAMDSRHDQILIAANLRNFGGMDYLPLSLGGNIMAVFATNTWNDPNHSYRCWGNDGTSFNGVLTTTGNAMVGPTVAQALINSVSGNGHLPVYLDVQVPAKTSAPANVNFGTVAVNSTAQLTIPIGNGASLALWSKDGTGRGIDTLNYSLAVSAGFTIAPGPFTDAPGGTLNSHIISMNTSTPGTKTGTLTITSDDPDSPSLVIALSGMVHAVTDYDVNNDGLVNIEDLYRWYAGATDVDGSGTIDAADAVALQSFLRNGEVPDTTDGLR
jgi:hypothetical protein